MMKKRYGFFLLFLFFLFQKTAFASNQFLIQGNQEVFNHHNFTVTVFYSGEDIYSLRFRFNYDSTKLQLVSSLSKNGFHLTKDGWIVLDDEKRHNGTFEIAQFTFAVKDDFVGNTNITLLNGEASTLKDIYYASDVNHSITIKKSSENPYKKGDMDRDGDVDVLDVMIALRVYFGITPSNSTYVSIGDINGNGKVDIIDVLYILKVSLGLIRGGW